MKILSDPRFLAIYSGTLTLVFVVAIFLAMTHGPVYAAADSRRAEFDQITVHRINLVEPDGTPRLILADKAEYPGSIIKGKEAARPDRSGAGILFLNDEGTENGGFLLSGYRGTDGIPHSNLHISFDEYQQDQTTVLETNQDGDARNSGIQFNDNGTGIFTPDIINQFENAKRLPLSTPAERAAAQKVFDQLLAKYPIQGHTRVYLGRENDHASVLRLKDALGRDRILLRVAPDGSPHMQFLDAAGHVTHQWPES
jgi:hypothetical protein